MLPDNFQHIIRVANTNVDGRQRVQYAITKIRGIGRRFSTLMCKKAEVDLKKRAGELSAEELERLVAIVSDPLQFKVPKWFLNRNRDFRNGKTMHLFSSGFDAGRRRPPSIPGDGGRCPPEFTSCVPRAGPSPAPIRPGTPRGRPGPGPTLGRSVGLELKPEADS